MSQGTVFLALASATDACCESVVRALISSLVLEGGVNAQRGLGLCGSKSDPKHLWKCSSLGTTVGPSQTCF